MRIVHVTPFYAPVIGGVEEVVRRVAEYMSSRGYEVFVVTYNRLRYGGMGSLPRYEVINGVHVIRVKPNLMFSHGSYSSELAEVIRVLKPDIVHVHVWRHPHVFQVARLKKILGFKAILHGHAPFHKLSQLGIAIWAYHRVVDAIGRGYLDLYDKFIALTPYERDFMLHNLGLPEDKTIIIPNGIDFPEIHFNINKNDECCEVLYLGRISREKNIPLLIKAMRCVVKELQDVKLTLVGPDEGIMKWVYDYARKHDFKHVIEYLGSVYGERRYTIYARTAVYALPSLYEAFAMTLLEAGIVGTPSVITGYGGQLYTAPPGIASLWAKPIPEDYARAIITILSNDELRRNLGRKAREHAKKFLWNKILPVYETLYNNILENH